MLRHSKRQLDGATGLCGAARLGYHLKRRGKAETCRLKPPRHFRNISRTFFLKCFCNVSTLRELPLSPKQPWKGWDPPIYPAVAHIIEFKRHHHCNWCKTTSTLYRSNAIKATEMQLTRFFFVIGPFSELYNRIRIRIYSQESLIFSGKGDFAIYLCPTLKFITASVQWKKIYVSIFSLNFRFSFLFLYFSLLVFLFNCTLYDS